MLPGENRLKKEKEFEAVFKGGRALKGKYVFLKYLINGTDKTRIGFVVSKKISKLATKRNKIKRRMREVARMKRKNIKEGLSIVFIALPQINGAEYEEIKKDMEIILDKEDLTKGR